MTISSNFVIEEAVNRLRECRKFFFFDDTATAGAGFEQMLDRLHPIFAAQVESGVRLRANADDEKARKRKLFLTKMMEPTTDWQAIEQNVRDARNGIQPDPVKLRANIDKFEADLEAMIRDGIRPGERQIYEALSPDEPETWGRHWTDETRRHLEALYPIRRAAMVETGLKSEKTEKRLGRPRKSGISEAERLESTSYIRHRKIWRAEIIATVCWRIADIEEWLEANPTDPYTIGIQSRYDFANLVTTNSKFVAVTDGVRIAAAILSADLIGPKPARHRANDKLALRVLRTYFSFQQAVKAARRHPNWKKSGSKSDNMPLILQRFQAS